MFNIEIPNSKVAIDLSHNVLLLGIVLSLKPKNILELGYGSGYSSNIILQGIEYNKCGELTVVDNWYDWKFKKPDFINNLKNIKIIENNEEDYVKNEVSNKYDLLISDADHNNSDKWIVDQLRIVRNNGILFFHDISNYEFPNLKNIIKHLNNNNISNYNFNFNSIESERCDRGWLLVFNKKNKIYI